MKKGYVPDISLFFADGRKATIEDILKLSIPEQESVILKQNDMYIDNGKPAAFNRMSHRRKNGFKKRQKRKFKRTYP